MRWTIPDLSFIRSLVVLDDFMQELSNYNKITSLFTHSMVYERMLSSQPECYLSAAKYLFFPRGNELRDIS